MVTFPDPEKFGKPKLKPSDKINPDDYHSLFEWEQTED